MIMRAEGEIVGNCVATNFGEGVGTESAALGWYGDTPLALRSNVENCRCKVSHPGRGEAASRVGNERFVPVGLSDALLFID
jgi:hypothetical protein